MGRLFFYRLLLSLAILVSAYCFLFVNRTNDSLYKHSVAQSELYQDQKTDEAPAETTKLPLPDLSMLEKAIEIVQRFL